MTPNSILAAEICLCEAWPAPTWRDLGGWVLRAGRNGYNRANSVWTGRFSGEIPLEDAIDMAEAFYREHGLSPRFQMLETAQPADLRDGLAARGYERELACSTLARPVATGRLPDGVTVEGEPAAEWLGVYVAGLDPDRAAELPAILGRLPPTRGFIVARIGDEPATVAVAVRVGSDVAVDCVLTRTDRLRSGGATKVMQAAEAWAAGEGARRMLLTVVNSNDAAMVLYAKLGYIRLSGYAYWFKRAAA